MNPGLHREKTFSIVPSTSPKKVAVIGGGMAGMEVARVMAERGHQVSLYEKENSLGGQFKIAALQPHKEAYNSFIEYQFRGMKRAGVKVFLNTEMKVTALKQASADTVVVATGAYPKVPAIEGAKGKNVVQANDVITGKAQTGHRVLIVGGRLLAMEVALQLAEQGKSVALTTLHLLGENGAPPERQLYEEYRNRLFNIGVQIFENAPVMEIREGGAYIVFHKALCFLKADTVVLAVGSEPNNKLVKELKEAGYSVHSIGDCVEPRDALLAVREGAELGRKI